MLTEIQKTFAQTNGFGIIADSEDEIVCRTFFLHREPTEGETYYNGWISSPGRGEKCSGVTVSKGRDGVWRFTVNRNGRGRCYHCKDAKDAWKRALSHISGARKSGARIMPAVA